MKRQQLGIQNVTVRVTDANGNIANQVYIILVQQQAGNHPPIITSTAVTSVPAGWTYSYPVHAVDPDGDPLTYSLLAGFPTNMSIDPVAGGITWLTTASNAGQSYPVTVQVSDGRGGVATQSFTISVTTATTLPAAIYGTKYNDQNGDGVRDSTAPGASQLTSLNLQALGIGVTAASMGYYWPGNSILVANLTAGKTTGNGPLPESLYQVTATGTVTLFATLSGVNLADGNTIGIVQPGNAAGFVPGDVFLSSQKTIIRITNRGASIVNPWLTLSSAVGSISELAFDTAGILPSPYTGGLLALTTGRELWEINVSGTAARLAQNLPTGSGDDGSFITVPNNSSLFGQALAGKILVVQDLNNAFTVDTSGNVVTVSSGGGLDSAEGVAIVPPSANFFAFADGDPNLYAA